MSDGEVHLLELVKFAEVGRTNSRHTAEATFVNQAAGLVYDLYRFQHMRYATESGLGNAYPETEDGHGREGSGRVWLAPITCTAM